MLDHPVAIALAVACVLAVIIGCVRVATRDA